MELPVMPINIRNSKVSIIEGNSIVHPVRYRIYLTLIRSVQILKDHNLEMSIAIFCWHDLVGKKKYCGR